MAGKKRPGGALMEKLKELYRLGKPIFCIIIVICLISGLVILFEHLPKHGSSPQSISQILSDLLTLYSPARVFRSIYENSKRSAPSFLPLWSVSPIRSHIDSRLPSTSEIEEDARRLLPVVQKTIHHSFFRIIKMNLGAECPFWVREDLCTSPSGGCSVCECDEDNIPTAWKNRPTENFVDRSLSEDFIPWEDEFDDYDDVNSNTIKGMFHTMNEKNENSENKKSETSYIDLGVNRAGNTGYGRTPIWSLIYKENCMGEPENPLASVAPSEKCREEEAFYMMLSGMQTTVTMLMAEHYFEKPDAVKSASLQRRMLSSVLPKYSLTQFRWRVAGYSQYMENLYFTFSLVARALCLAQPIFDSCPCDTGDLVETTAAKLDLQSLLSEAESLNSCKPEYLKEPIFDRKASLALRQFRNISRIMDCVDCESCRLHAKIKVLALYQVLKATSVPRRLFQMERNDMIAFLNGLAYFTEALVSVRRFRLRVLGLKLLWCSIFLLSVVISVFLCYMLYRRYKRRLSPRARVIQQYQKQWETSQPMTSVNTLESLLEDSPHHVRKRGKGRG